ncbi:DNA-binding HxlR family transcriptional regulator [Sphingobium sp. B1D7B]|uniref:winged helix-turn-helix transcriptional regulator n=1 Tax=Sphingobium sp. B1D7B TaxID=2940578 RepID=UPI0022258499|nr:helix-turn-helix domain-containing protein [Sphingobium sp. B1D7B]MCW2406841.1 DNA-binding HxlR family transcriptional regulator [Sphingobium sp. B1D7B]
MVAHKSLEERECPIARSLQHVGEWWNILILRDSLAGFTRFDEFQRNLGIAPGMLTRRLRGLVEAGMLEKRLYSDRPQRFEYVPTARGEDFRDVLVALLAFGNRHFAPEGLSVTVLDTRTGIEAEPVMVDAASGTPLSDPAFRWISGPAAGSETRSRYLMGPPEGGQRW